MTTVYHRRDNSYDLILRDMSCNNYVMVMIPIGDFNKVNRRTLNLLECHNLICGQNHDGVVKCHGPVTDVIFTKFIVIS